MQLKELSGKDIEQWDVDSLEFFQFIIECRKFATRITRRRRPDLSSFDVEEITLFCVSQVGLYLEKIYRDVPVFYPWYQKVVNNGISLYIRNNWRVKWGRYTENFTDRENCLRSRYGVGVTVDFEYEKSDRILSYHEYLELRWLFFKLEQMLAEDHMQFFIKHHIEEKTYADIAREHSVSRQYVQKSVRSTRDHLLTDLLEALPNANLHALDSTPSYELEKHFRIAGVSV